MSKAERKNRSIKRAGREWSAWQDVKITPEFRSKSPHLKNCRHIFANTRFEVQMFECASTIGGVMQAVVARHGHLEPIQNTDIQRIKDELFPESTAVEVFDPRAPAMKVRILWILPASYELPFGLKHENAWGGQ